ncbi:MAG: hypothetical protein V4629_04100 [Pseudomonadota bacterium]
MSFKEIIGLLATIITFIAFFPYIRDILKDLIKPHIFSWIIWGVTTLFVFFAQLKANGGAGAWVGGISGVITLVIACLAYIKRSDNSISKTDWIFLISALLSLPVWYITSDPLWSVIILTAIDLLGFGPTFRKSYHDPYSESLVFYGWFVFRNILILFALESYSLTTVLFPAAVGLACGIFILMLIWRRQIIKN